MMSQRTIEHSSLVHTQNNLSPPILSLRAEARKCDVGAQGPCRCSKTIISLLSTLADLPTVPVSIILIIISPQRPTGYHFQMSGLGLGRCGSPGFGESIGVKINAREERPYVDGKGRPGGPEAHPEGREEDQSG